jgi:hypothetical protein
MKEIFLLDSIVVRTAISSETRIIRFTNEWMAFLSLTSS